ncbi:MAG: prepilin peptidase, partial [Caulobacteraceae bacterium]|nr:prepilin peptidase [Caulobacteraceae bacterium]
MIPLLSAVIAAPATVLCLTVTRNYVTARQTIAVAIGASMATAFLWAALATPPNLILVASLGLAWSLVTLAAIDLACFRLPDKLTFPLIAAGLGLVYLLPGRPLLDHLIGAAGGWS